MAITIRGKESALPRSTSAGWLTAELLTRGRARWRHGDVDGDLAPVAQPSRVRPAGALRRIDAAQRVRRGLAASIVVNAGQELVAGMTLVGV